MDGIELSKAIARVRRAMPRNADVMALCDYAEAFPQREKKAVTLQRADTEPETLQQASLKRYSPRPVQSAPRAVLGMTR